MLYKHRLAVCYFNRLVRKFPR